LNKVLTVTETASRRPALAIVSPAAAAPPEGQTFRHDRRVADPFANLNPQQQAAVAHGRAPLLVLAGAGSGKTLTLAARVARLVLDGADPNRLLLLTFSRRASQEMAQRAGRVLHQALGLRATQAPPVLPWAGTFHAIGARLLREYAPSIGLPEHFSIIDRGDAEDLMAWMRQQQGLAAMRKRFPLKATCLSIYSRCVNRQVPLAEVLREDFPWCAEWHDDLKALFRAYAAEKLGQHTLDYDDLLLAWHQMLGDAGLAAHLGARFDQVLVDEYQDTNRLQAGILQRLKPDGCGLTVVGDDAQAIYSFRAAEVGNILGFAAQFGTAARVITLDRNYRSTQPILDASNAVIALAPERHAKTLWCDRPSAQRPLLVTVVDELAQARWVADHVLAQREGGLRLKQQAVLFRTGHHSAALELELARRNIPFVKFGGLKFLEAAHIKDFLAFLRWAQNPRCRLAGFRVAQLLPGFGPAQARRLLDAVAAAEQPAQAIQDFVPPAAGRVDWHALAALLAVLQTGQRTTANPPASTAASTATKPDEPAAQPVPWPGELDAVLAWYAPHLRRLYSEDAPVRQLDLDQLQRLAAGTPSRERFLTDLTLDPPEATSDESGPPLQDEDYLILSTIHSAKGQEWNAVTVLNVVDGCMPADLATGSAAAIAEERRLLYVAMTRAKQHLALIVPLRFHVSQQHHLGDRHLYGGLSRFIPPAVAALFERVAATADGPLTGLSPSATPPVAAMPIRLGSAWD
jgi:DNA helicase-2/ATP-dependent DNA helicase PcrA